jgi:hypothetical protein
MINELFHPFLRNNPSKERPVSADCFDIRELSIAVAIEIEPLFFIPEVLVNEATQGRGLLSQIGNLFRPAEFARHFEQQAVR